MAHPKYMANSPQLASLRAGSFFLQERENKEGKRRGRGGGGEEEKRK